MGIVTLPDAFLLVSTVVVVLVPWVALRKAEARRRLQWARFLISVLLAQSVSMVAIPYQQHAWRRGAFIAALFVLAIGALVVLVRPVVSKPN
jgi:hypothetical protein